MPHSLAAVRAAPGALSYSSPWVTLRILFVRSRLSLLRDRHNAPRATCFSINRKALCERSHEDPSYVWYSYVRVLLICSVKSFKGTSCCCCMLVRSRYDLSLFQMMQISPSFRFHGKRFGIQPVRVPWKCECSMPHRLLSQIPQSHHCNLLPEPFKLYPCSCVSVSTAISSPYIGIRFLEICVCSTLERKAD